MLIVWGRLISYTKKGCDSHAQYELNLLYALIYRDVEFKLNQFADLSPDEFKRNVLMHPREPPKFSQNLVK